MLKLASSADFHKQPSKVIKTSLRLLAHWSLRSKMILTKLKRDKWLTFSNHVTMWQKVKELQRVIWNKMHPDWQATSWHLWLTWPRGDLNLWTSFSLLTSLTLSISKAQSPSSSNNNLYASWMRSFSRSLKILRTKALLSTLITFQISWVIFQSVQSQKCWVELAWKLSYQTTTRPTLSSTLLICAVSLKTKK